MCCRMAPSKNVRRGRPLRHSPVATRPRAAASRAAVARSAPAECHVVQHFDDEPALQQVARPAADAAAGRRGTTEERLSSMERRLEASDKMLQEVLAMLRGLPQLPPTNALPAPPPIAAPMAMASSAGGSPSLRPWLTFVYGGRAAIHQVGWHCLRLALHQALFQDQGRPRGQRPYLQVFIQVMKYTLSPGYPRI